MKNINLSKASAIAGIAQQRIVDIAGRNKISPPFSANELDLIKRCNLTSISNQSTEGQAQQQDARSLEAIAQNSLDTATRSGFSSRELPAISSCEDQRNSATSNQRWKIIGAIALGAITIAGAAFISSVLPDEDDEDDCRRPEEDWYVPTNFAGHLPDGTPTFWGARGGRFYRSNSGRKVYI